MVLIKALRIDTTCNHSKNFLTGNLNDCFYFGCKKGIGTINNYYWWVGKIVKRGKYEKYNKADDKDL